MIFVKNFRFPVVVALFFSWRAQIFVKNILILENIYYALYFICSMVITRISFSNCCLWSYKWLFLFRPYGNCYYTILIIKQVKFIKMVEDIAFYEYLLYDGYVNNGESSLYHRCFWGSNIFSIFLSNRR